MNPAPDHGKGAGSAPRLCRPAQARCQRQDRHSGCLRGVLAAPATGSAPLLGVTWQPALHRPHRAPQQEERAALSQQVSCAPRGCHQREPPQPSGSSSPSR